MALSFSTSGDVELQEHLREIKNHGAHVVVTTSEDSEGLGQIVRTATITWTTHNVDGRVLA